MGWAYVADNNNIASLTFEREKLRNGYFLKLNHFITMAIKELYMQYCLLQLVLI